MIKDNFFTIIASANIQQLRWFQDKFYLISKIRDDWESNYKYREVKEKLYPRNWLRFWRYCINNFIAFRVTK